MSVNFEKTAYLQAFKENENLSGDKQVFNYVKSSLQFKYGDVSCEKFNGKYSEKGFLGRKVIALPLAVWSAVVKVIYHLAKAIFRGIPEAFSDKGNYLKVQVFCVLRDFLEAWGWLTSLFNDRYGQFHIQESQFQKACYECFRPNPTLNTSASSNKITSINTNTSSIKATSRTIVFCRSSSLKHGVMVDNEAKKTSLSNYKEKTVEERNQLIQRFNLDQICLKLNLDDFVNQADLEVLKILTLEDLIIPLQHSKLKFALLGDEKFNALTLGDIEKGNNQDQFMFITQRLKLYKNEELEEPLIYRDANDVLLRDLAKFSAENIHNYKKNIPSTAFMFCRNDQIQKLKLSEMQAPQNTALFFGLDEAETKERLSHFDVQDVVDAVHNGLIPDGPLKFLTVDHIKKLKLPQLNKKQVDIIFCWKKSSEQVASCFKLFDTGDVEKAIKEGILTTSYQMKLLSDDQLKGIKLSNLSDKIIYSMFPWAEDNTADRERFANFEVIEVASALYSGLITSPYQLKLLSDKQLKNIELSKLSEGTIDKMFPWSNDNTADRERFANFEVLDVQSALNSKLIKNTYQLKLLSDKQLKGLQLSKLHKETIESMFPWCKDNTADRERFANFGAVDVQSALDSDKLNNYQAQLISREQIKEFDFSILSQKVVNMIFPNFSVDYLREEHSNWSSSFVSINGKVLENKQGKECNYSEKELQKMSQDQKQNNEELLAQIPVEQRKILEPRLYQK